MSQDKDENHEGLIVGPWNNKRIYTSFTEGDLLLLRRAVAKKMVEEEEKGGMAAALYVELLRHIIELQTKMELEKLREDKKNE